MPINPRNPRIYLASRSPRRRELLAQVGIHFETLLFRNPPREDAEVDETSHPDESPVGYVQRVSRAKAEHGWRLVKERRLMAYPVLAADTTLEFDGRIIGKPTDRDDALSILKRLSGQTHRVLTAVVIAFEERLESALSVSEVSFGAIGEDEIRSYVASGEPMDKAGAYGIQGHAGLFVRHLSGSYTGVMGLPLYETGALLRRFNYPFRA